MSFISVRNGFRLGFGKLKSQPLGINSRRTSFIRQFHVSKTLLTDNKPKDSTIKDIAKEKIESVKKPSTIILGNGEDVDDNEKSTILNEDEFKRIVADKTVENMLDEQKKKGPKESNQDNAGLKEEVIGSRSQEDDELLKKLFGKPIVGIESKSPTEEGTIKTTPDNKISEKKVLNPKLIEIESSIKPIEIRDIALEAVKELENKYSEIESFENNTYPPVTPEETIAKLNKKFNIHKTWNSSYTAVTKTISTNPVPQTKRLFKRAYVKVRSFARSKLSQFYTWLWTTVVPQVSKLFNELTGYSAVQKTKERVLQLDDELASAKLYARNSKLAYEKIVEDRHKVQRELSSLLQRKDTWTDHDITRFTEVYRKDVNFEHEELDAKKEQKKAANEFDEYHRLYLNGIRERYIEEQLYSDKIRRASTWWTWGLISLHFLLFILVQLVFEPRKRKNMVDNIREEFLVTTDNMMKRLEEMEGKRIKYDEENRSKILFGKDWKDIQQSLSSLKTSIKSAVPIAKKVENTDSNSLIGENKDEINKKNNDSWYIKFYNESPITIIPHTLLRKLSTEKSLEFLDGAVLGTAFGIFSTALLFFLKG